MDCDYLIKTVKEFKNKGFDAEGLPVDVSSESSVVDGIRQVEEKAGQIHIMVNAAGIVGLSSTKITDYPVEDYDNIYRVNLRGSFLMTKYAVKSMEKYNYGRILLIASIAGKEGNPFMTGYSSMKAGVIGLVKGIGKETANKLLKEFKSVKNIKEKDIHEVSKIIGKAKAAILLNELKKMGPG